MNAFPRFPGLRSRLIGRGLSAALPLLACAALVAPLAVVASESYKISGVLAGGGSGTGTPKISPDGTRVVFIADGESRYSYDLFSAPIGGGAPVNLTDNLGIGGYISFAITSDSTRVVYLSGYLYSVPVTGGTPVLLNDTNSNIGSYQLTPDGSRVIYVADVGFTGVQDLYSVPVTGGTPVKLSDTLVAGGEISGFAVSSDSARAVYVANRTTLETSELFSVPVVGGTPVKLNGTLASGGRVELDFKITSDSHRVVYRADQTTNEVYELFSASITAGLPVKLNGTLAAGGDVLEFHLSPDGDRVVYLADQTTDNVDELYSVPATGGTTPVKLNGTLVSGGNVWSTPQISPDGSRVVYLADQDTNGIWEIYSVPITGGIAPVKLNGTLAVGRAVCNFHISPDGNRVVYLAYQHTNDVTELYSVPTTGGTAPVKLSGALVTQGDVQDHQITPDGSRVIYHADQDTDEVLELYSVPVSGGTVLKLNGPLVAGGDVGTFQTSPDNSRVVYLADQDTVGVNELYVARGYEHWTTSGGSWETAANWEFGIAPDLTTDAVVSAASVVTLSGGSTPRAVDTLVLGGGAGTSVLDLQGGAALTAAHGVTLLGNGVLGGDGVVSTGGLVLSLPASAEIGAGAGDTFTLISGTVTNAGRIEALGRAASIAELDFVGFVNNLTSTGLITAHDAILRFRSNLLNGGYLTLSGGFNDILGDIGNQASGHIVVSGGATAIFYDKMTNSGAIQVSGTTSLKSMAVFFGDFSGTGTTGTGIVFLEGDTRPGASPGTMSFGGDVVQGSLATLHVEIAGTTPGSGYDRLDVAGELALAGTLAVTFINGFTPSAGDTFDLWDAGSVSGQFDTVVLPTLPPGLFWHTARLDTEGLLSVGVTPQSYAGYALAFGLTTPATGDQEHDGFPNLVEYALGQNPVQASNGNPGLPVLVKGAFSDTFTFAMPNPAGSDLELEIQMSGDLENWSKMAEYTGGQWSGMATATPVAPGWDRITLNQPSMGIPRRFYRLAARLSP